MATHCSQRPMSVGLLATLLLLTLCEVGVARPKDDDEEVPDGAASLAFVFDVTGSMYDDLVQVIDGAAKILATTLSRREKPLWNYVLVPFHDPDVGPVVLTRDPYDFQHELRSLYVQGGGDCPEMSISAIKEAIDVSLPNSFIYVFTDARSKDYALTDEVLALIQRKQSQVVFVLTGDCGNRNHAGYFAYEEIASTSSGQVFLLQKSQVNEVEEDPGHPQSQLRLRRSPARMTELAAVLNFVRVAVQSRKVNLMSIDVATSGENEYVIPIDSKLREVTFSVSGENPKIYLIDPSGKNVSKLEGLKILLDIRKALVVNMKDPLPGGWKLVVKADDKHTIRITGLSTTNFVTGFSRKPVKHMKHTSHRPIGGIPTHIMLNVTDLDLPAGFQHLEVIDLQGNSLGQYQLERDEKMPNIYRLPPFKPPEKFFYIKLTGVDDKGYPIQRLTPTAITRVLPGKPNVFMTEVTKGYFGLTAVLTCHVDSLIPVTVRWYKEDVVLGPQQFFNESTNTTFEIPAANQFSEGMYFCQAINDMGESKVPTFLDISDPPPSITVPQNVSVLLGEDALLTCNVFSTVDFNVTWYGDGYRDRIRPSPKFVDFNNGSLLVRSVRKTDEGRYTCVAANEGGKSEQHAYIKLQEPPKVFVDPEKTTFIIGETKELVCTYKGYPDPEIHWLRAGSTMIPGANVVIHGNRLKLKNMQRGDEGEYECLGVNPAGKDTATGTIYFIEEPEITLYESKVLVAAGDNAVLECLAKGIPSPEIKWFRGEVELKELSYVQITDSGQLTILGAQKLDAGQYTCKAVNEAGEDSVEIELDIGDPGQLTILGAQKLDAGQYTCKAVNEAGEDSVEIELDIGATPTISVPPDNVGADIGTSAALDCVAEGSPDPVLYWKRDDGKNLDLGTRVYQLPSGSLVIKAVGLQDEGSYSCVAQNQFGVREASATLSITGIVRPLISYMEPVVSVVQGESVSLNCQAMLGNPPPTVFWARYGSRMTPDEYVTRIGDGDIIIDDVQPFHSGDYKCLASNVGGNASFTVTVIVQVPPRFSYDYSDSNETEFNITEGESVILPCDVIGDPRPTISWYKDEVPILLTDPHYFITEDWALEIFSAESVDTGEFTCSAANDAGEIEKRMFLTVHVPPTISGDPEERYIVVENETAVLPCEVEGFPKPRVKWRKSFQTLNTVPSGYLAGEHGLTIHKATIADKAIYECVAKNKAGEASKAIALIVQVPARLTSGYDDMEQIVKKGEDVLLNCENSGDPPPIVQWFKDEQIMSVFDLSDSLHEQGTGSIYIPSAAVRHSGNYLCVVENPAGTVTKDFVLVVQDPPSLPANLSAYTDVQESSPIILSCPASGTPLPLVTWYKDDTLITGDQVGVVVLEDGSLQISDTRAEDSAAYKCVAENEAGRVDHEIELKVLVPPKLTGKDSGNPGVIDNTNVIVTNSVNITCPVESDPSPQITWLKDNIELDHSALDPRLSISANGKVLKIVLSEVDDTARYTCLAENVAGQVEKSFDLDVHVPPKVDGSASADNNTVVVDNSLYLDCPVKGIPRPKVIWYKDGEVIFPDLDPNINLVADGRRLEVVGARVTDTGRYTCVGENVAGRDEKNFDVEVQVPPRIDKPGEISKPEVVRDRPVTLKCPASGIPLPDIAWYKGNVKILDEMPEYSLLDMGWTLQINSAAEQDSTRFTCRAKNPAGEGEKAFDVNVLIPPSINRDGVNFNPTVIVNQSTIINCQVEGKPTPDITWFKNDVRLDATHTVQSRYEILAGGRQLRVIRAQLEDTAQYKCEADNKAGQDSATFELEVQVPTRINLNNVDKNPKVNKGRSLTLPCPASGVPPPVITWYKNGQAFQDRDFPNVSITNGGKLLTITGAQVSDTAQYTCKAENKAGEKDANFKVDVQVPPSIDKDEVNPNPHVEIGNSVSLDCPAEGIPTPVILWMKDGLPIDYEANLHYTLEADGRRLTVARSEVKDGGRFTCVAANAAGEAEQDYELDVWEEPSIESTSQELNPRVIKSHTTSLFCPAKGNPKPLIMWLKDGEQVQLDSRVYMESMGRELVIENATETDTARYQCVARNPAGQDSLIFNLEVHVPPTIDESNVVYDRKVLLNRTIIIECPVAGIPPPVVTWQINRQPMVLRQGLSLSNNDYHLTIDSAQVSDSATYYCIALNEAGELTKKFKLEVQVPPIIDVSQVPTTIFVNENQTVTIHCPVTGIPTPSIMWLHNNYPLLDWPYPGLSLSPDEKVLEVVSAKVKDEGKYTCQATSPAGLAKQDFNVSVRVPPNIAGSDITSILSVIQGNSLILPCVALGIPTPTLAWMKDKVNIEVAEFPQYRIGQLGESLQIVNAQPADSGSYDCQAENVAGVQVRTFMVEVQVPPSITMRGIQKVWAVINDSLTLECPAVGTPPPVITWVRKGREILRTGSHNIKLTQGGRRLTLEKAQLIDLGDYVCVAKNEAGEERLVYDVAVYFPPSIEEGPTREEAEIHNPATLFCETLGLPEPVVTWEKDGQTFPGKGLRHSMRDTGSIDFSSVRLEDAGVYRCTAKNEAGSIAREIQLEVQVPPTLQFEQQPMPVASVINERVVLPCKVTGNPTPTILWQKGAKIISGDEGYQIIGNGSIVIPAVTQDDAGMFICIARNNAGTAFGRIRLRVYKVPEIKEQKNNFTKTASESVILPCRASGRPRPKYTWLKNGEKISRSSSYMRVLRTGLGFPFVRPEDAGVYTCKAHNLVGEDTVQITLNVQVPPTIAEAQRIVTFTVGDDATIDCAAIGIPPPTVVWLKAGRQIEDDNRKFQISKFGALEIRSVTQADTGSYTCLADNGAGKATQERLVRVQVPPSFTVVPHNNDVTLNSRLTLRCTANGVPTPTIHWLKDGLPIETPPSVVGRSVYVVSSVRTEDSGVYTCLAQNPAGQATTESLVTVRIPPEILTPPDNKAVVIAERVILPCKVGGDPQPEVMWMKNGRTVQLSDRIQQLNNGSLVIYQSTTSDAGEYKCVATNEFGISEGVAMLTIREPPSFEVEPQNTIVDEGENVLIECVGSGEPVPTMEWMLGWDVLQNKGRLSIMLNNTLSIISAQLSDSNTYRCLASNNLGKSFIEVNLTVVVHGEWSAWSDWEACSQTCGEGRQLRHRSCDSPEPANQGEPCPGQAVEAKSCVEQKCPVDGEWGDWMPWEPCSASCDVGVKARRRQCDNPRPQYGGAPCHGDDTDVDSCNIRPCAVDGGWGEWSDWQPCSTTCGQGQQERYRHCNSPQPSYRGRQCRGHDMDRQTCKLRECPVDGSWGGWGHWTQCTLSCGGGERTRQRLCNYPAPEYGGLFCVGQDSQRDYCNSEPCPVHGGWSSWNDWGACSVSCNGGLQRRFRSCNSPTPSNSGRQCVGTGEDSQTCNQVPCPVNGKWSDWSAWSGCSQSCDEGTKQRTRQCRQPMHGGSGCIGDTIQKTDCFMQKCYGFPTVAEGKLVGYINNIDIPAGTFKASMLPLPDNTATHVDATITNIPPILVSHFRHLVSLLSPIYWTTAMEIDGASNGFRLTDGDFTREVQVQYASGEILKMSHYAKGVDHNGKLQLDIVVRGNVPEIADTEVVRVFPYWEQYLQTGAGSVHAQSTRLFHVGDQMLPYAWNHSITYDNPHLNMPYLVQRLHAKNLEVYVSPDKELVNMKLDTSIFPGSPSNRCPQGFELNPAGPYCQDEDECQTLRPCSDYCHNNQGSFSCSCPIGFALDYDGRQCVDVDECEGGFASCEGDKQCVNTIGSFQCQMACSKGYKPSEDGLRCVDIDECTDRPDICDQLCVNKFGGYRCKCLPGFRKERRGGRCVDIDECELSSPPCEQVCANAEGSYLCSCRNGFELVTGGRCKDINECKTGANNCRQDENCVNSRGTFTCVTLCPKGQHIVSGRCVDIDECSTGKHRCYYNQQCINTDPGYRCLCPRGYISAGPGTPCLDIDECVTSPSVCTYRCENTYGDYECVCPPGQVRLADRKSCAGLEFLEPVKVIDTNRVHAQADQSGYHRNRREAVECPGGWRYNSTLDKCIDRDECKEDPGICQHNCTNTLGSYTCSCPPGYRANKKGNCEDIDECTELKINCGKEKMCFNTLGEFTCIDIPCPKGHQRDPITNYCVLECIDAEIACPPNAKYADVIEFRTLALPSGVLADRDLILLTAYNAADKILKNTVFKILENDKKVSFRLRIEQGRGIVFTPQPLEDKHLYKIMVKAQSYDNTVRNIQYQTTFMIHIAVSAYPY